jgi:Fe-S-cluster containining protein
MIGPDELNKSRRRIESDNRKFYTRLKKRPPAGIDEEVISLDEEVFAKIDCLACANCCKTISPVFKDRDIDRIAKHFKMRPGEFTEKYLFLDEDGDYVLKTTPCPFLMPDNKCRIYDQRPFACKSYPHTATLPLTKSTELIIKNSAVCPAVHEITEKLKAKYI